MNDYGFTYGEDTNEWRKSNGRTLAVVYYEPLSDDYEWRIYFDYGGRDETVLCEGWAEGLSQAMSQADDFLTG